jgi:hypothetical protein
MCQTRKRRYNLQVLFTPERGSFGLYRLYFPTHSSCHYIELRTCPHARFVLFQRLILIYRNIPYNSPSRAKIVTWGPVLKMLYVGKHLKKLCFDPHGLISYGVTLKCNCWLYLRYSINFLVIFDGAANNSDYIASNDRMTVSDKLEMAWKEAAVS